MCENTHRALAPAGTQSSDAFALPRPDCSPAAILIEQRFSRIKNFSCSPSFAAISQFYLQSKIARNISSTAVYPNSINIYVQMKSVSESQFTEAVYRNYHGEPLTSIAKDFGIGQSTLSQLKPAARTTGNGYISRSLRLKSCVWFSQTLPTTSCREDDPPINSI